MHYRNGILCTKGNNMFKICIWVVPIHLVCRITCRYVIVQWHLTKVILVSIFRGLWLSSEFLRELCLTKQHLLHAKGCLRKELLNCLKHLKEISCHFIWWGNSKSAPLNAIAKVVYYEEGRYEGICTRACPNVHVHTLYMHSSY